jgi:hypothetical protein
MYEALGLIPSMAKRKKKKLRQYTAGRQWLMPVILATQEAEMRRTMRETLSLKNPLQKGLVNDSRCRP